MSELPVLCFPFAGAGASVYRRCHEIEATGIRICPVQLPGREELTDEPLCTDAATAVGAMLPEIMDLVEDSPRVALFGHSLGAILAYETAHQLREIDGPVVTRLFVSGSPGPWSRRANRATGLTDEQFLDRVQELAGYQHPALAHPELRELLLPILRADVAMHENYRPPVQGRLDVPITTLRGDRDELVSAQEAAEWAAASTAECRAVELSGGHMYLVDSPAALVGALEQLS
ncbi:MAG TPA: alpha/beta fold hydrolase [Jatrophihabitans sp.]|jgi:surfactin synthase thioesterase subunit|nr:alpha/beta fold hydrolase [Jatrophihabitans sp.]